MTANKKTKDKILNECRLLKSDLFYSFNVMLYNRTTLKYISNKLSYISKKVCGCEIYHCCLQSQVTIEKDY
jgi:hypothetical protein